MQYNTEYLDDNQRDKIYYPLIDIIKVISCICIVCIHTRPFEGTCFQDFYARICPTFVSIFFILSSLMFWNKIKWDTTDKSVLIKYIKRLFVLYILWSAIFSPIWVYELWKEVGMDIIWVLPLRILFYRGCSGSWFITSLIYGTIIVYFLNRYLNKHIVLGSICLVFLYFGYVYWGGSDFLHINWERGEWYPAPYYSAVRSIFWIECAFYVTQQLKGQQIRLPIAIIIAMLWGVSSYFKLLGGTIYSECIICHYCHLL